MPAFFSMVKVKLIIFDLDGTILDAYPAIIKSFNYSMDKLGYPKQPDLVIRRAVGWGDKGLLAPFVAAQDAEKAVALYRLDHRRSLVKYSRVFNGAYRLLAQLKAMGYNLAVASNRPTEFSLILLRHLKLGKYFDYVLCADKLKVGKPHPEILIKILRKFKVKNSEAIYVGDMVIDAQAGRCAGIKTIIVTTGSSSLAQIKKEKPCLIIKRISELADIL